MSIVLVSRVLLAGANGFIGRARVNRIGHDGIPVTASVRRAASNPIGIREVRVAELGPATD